jgi:hypothetical protein
VSVIINGEMVKMAIGTYGTDHLIAFKNYTDTSFTQMYSYMFLIYLSTGDYAVSTGTGNIAFMSFSSNPLKDSTTYYIPAGTYVCQVFVNAGARLFVTLKKKYEEVVRHIYSYALKCESMEGEDMIYDEFYEQIADGCVSGSSLNSAICKKALAMSITDDPRFKLIQSNNLNKIGSIVNGEWVVTENSCPATCGTGSKKSSREILKYLGRGAAEKTLETTTVDCSVPCSVNGYFSNWSSWTACSKTCGGGTQTRNRMYYPAVNGGTELADRNNTSESQACNINPCAVANTVILRANGSLSGSSNYAYSPFTRSSPNGLYRFRWNGSLSFFIDKYVNYSWTQVSSMKLFGYSGSPSVRLDGAGHLYLDYKPTYGLVTIEKTYMTSTCYTAITDGGDWIKQDGSSIVTILRNGQNK